MSSQIERYISLRLDNQMKIINGMLRNMGLADMKLTFVARHPSIDGRFIIKTDDDTKAVAELLVKP